MLPTTLLRKNQPTIQTSLGFQKIFLCCKNGLKAPNATGLNIGKVFATFNLATLSKQHQAVAD